MARPLPPYINDATLRHEFLVLDGRVNQLGEAVFGSTRPGVDGHGFRLLGKRARPFSLTGKTDIDGTFTTVKDLEAAYKTSQSKLCTIYDSHRDRHTGMMLLNATVVSAVTLTGAVGGLAPGGHSYILVTTRFLFQATKVPT